jgi:diguanylate cyclase (GGDEF)-like protein/PAS domain S-box-containing protein
MPSRQNQALEAALLQSGGNAHAGHIDGDSELPTTRLLEAAVDNVSFGLAMFDDQARLLWCNIPYLDMYGLQPDILTGECTLHQLLELQVRAGTFFGDIDHAVAKILDIVASGRPAKTLDERVDGKAIAVMTTPLGDGGWLATHEDVTELTQRMRQLSQTKNFFDTIIEHVPATIIVKDAWTRRYLLINKKGEEFLGCSKQQIVGKTAHEMFSPEAAKAIDDHDQEVLIAGQQIGYESIPLHLPDDDSHLIVTQKLLVPGGKGRADFLLSIIEDVTERVRAATLLSHQAHHDALTGLANRVLFAERIDSALNDMKRHGGDRVTIMLLDLDRFKSVNDTLGHPVGDNLLKAVAERLRALLQDNELVARLGGDEFALMQIANGDQREAAIALSSRVLDELSTTFQIDGHQIVTDTSIGIAFAPEHGTDVERLLKCADLALYQAKTQGRGQYYVFDAAIETQAQSRHALEIDLRKAIAQNEFEIHYQSIFDIATGRPCGVEALVRWQRPSHGIVPPGDFIPLAEETGLIVPLGEWILHQVCVESAAFPPQIKVAINLSAVQFGKGDLVATVSRALTESGLAPDRLELEITESVLLHGNEQNIATLAALKSLGLSIVLDDFGTGYSSLSYLRMFQFDKIKIDRSFVNELCTRSDCAAIVCAITSLSRALNIVTTAEGVETADQYRLLRSAGCALAQGYLFSRPVPAAALRLADEASYPVEDAA